MPVKSRFIGPGDRLIHLKLLLLTTSNAHPSNSVPCPPHELQEDATTAANYSVLAAAIFAVVAILQMVRAVMGCQ